MKKIKYQYMVDDSLYGAEVDWSEANEEIVKAEAYNGVYDIFDDGQPDPEVDTALEARVYTLETDSTEMKEALNMILNGVTE